MTTLREAAQQALEALERAALQPVGKSTHDAITALKAALEQPEQKAECDGGTCGLGGYCDECPKRQPEQEPELQLDGMTPLQFALEELHAFQEATGCDTASEFRAALEQPYAEQARRVEQETHGRMRINPVTGDVSIGTPTEQPEPRNQCGETCERAKLCAVCAKGLEQDVPETDCGKIEPVAWLNSRPLYYDPPRREWRGLTEEEIHNMPTYQETREMYRLARAVEQALKEKNNE